MEGSNQRQNRPLAAFSLPPVDLLRIDSMPLFTVESEEELLVTRAVDISDQTIQQILNLYRIVYGEKASFNPFIRMLSNFDPAPWLWKNLGYPADPSLNMIGLAFRSGQLVGYTSYIARRAWVNGSMHWIMQSNDSMVHPDFRNQGLFTNLVQTLNRITLRQTGISLFYSFPNTQNPRIRHQSTFANHIVGHVPFVVKHPLQAKPVDGVQVLDSFPEDVSGISEAMAAEYQFGLVKDKAYLTWRYLDNVHNRDQYHILGAYAGHHLQGLAVTKLFEDSTGRRGHIVDLISSTPQVTRKLVQAAEQFLVQLGVDECSTFSFPSTHHHEVLVDEGYIQKPWSSYFVIGSFAQLAEVTSLAPDNTFILPGANDIF